MFTGIARVGDREYVACPCFYHLVLVLKVVAFVYTTEDFDYAWCSTPQSIRAWLQRCTLIVWTSCFFLLDVFNCGCSVEPLSRPARVRLTAEH